MIFFALDSPNKFIFHHPYYTMQSSDFLLYWASKMSHVFALFPLPVVQLTWYPSINLLNLFHFSWAIENSLFPIGHSPNFSACCFCVCESSSFNNACNSTFSNSFDGFPHSVSSFLSCVEITTFETSKSYDGHVHHKLLEVIGMIWQQFSSNQNKKLMPSAIALRSV